ncbi:hypothetical protein CI610_03299 [invertebrate metagenome]|uniref:Uncharacterized protein n=1 Tax=invertebrate metagenome TaxID=1711999 RepID=A0A2H9T3J6_9ZZZZ
MEKDTHIEKLEKILVDCQQEIQQFQRLLQKNKWYEEHFSSQSITGISLTVFDGNIILKEGSDNDWHIRSPEKPHILAEENGNITTTLASRPIELTFPKDPGTVDHVKLVLMTDTGKISGFMPCPGEITTEYGNVAIYTEAQRWVEIKSPVSNFINMEGYDKVHDVQPPRKSTKYRKAKGTPPPPLKKPKTGAQNLWNSQYRISIGNASNVMLGNRTTMIIDNTKNITSASSASSASSVLYTSSSSRSAHTSKMLKLANEKIENAQKNLEKAHSKLKNDSSRFSPNNSSDDSSDDSSDNWVPQADDTFESPLSSKYHVSIKKSRNVFIGNNCTFLVQGDTVINNIQPVHATYQPLISPIQLLFNPIRTEPEDRIIIRTTGKQMIGRHASHIHVKYTGCIENAF